MPTKRWPLLVVVLVLLGLAFWLGRRDRNGSGAAAGTGMEAQAEPIVFPRQRRIAKRSRAILAPQPGRPSVPDDEPEPSALPADALERAVLQPGGGGAVFVELNAIRHSELAEKILRCRGAELGEGMRALTEQLGVDPERDIDRVAVSRDVFAVTGFFEDLRLPEQLGEGRALGESGRLYEIPIEGGDPDAAEYLAVVGDNLVLASSDEASLQGALDRLEGRAEVGAPPVFEGDSGEIYGSLGPAFIGALLEDSQDPVAQRMAELLSAGLLRASIDEQVALSLDLYAEDAQTGEDLARAVGGAIAAARLRASQQGDHELVRLLEQARVQPRDDGRFELDLALPGELILEAMGCDPNGQPLGNSPAAQPEPTPL